MSTPDQTPPPEERKEPTVAQMFETMAARSGIKRNEHGQMDLMSAIGGWRGLCETVLPGLVFLVSFIVDSNLWLSLALAVAVAVLFGVVRAVQRGSVTSALSGLIGIVICAIFARTTGKALDYYVPGFFIDAISIAVILISVLSRWPVTGIIFGFLRGEGAEWRKNAERLRAYHAAAWIVLALFAARLLVQVPLYFAANVPALGIARLVMGVPLYVLALWLAWLVSRPVPSTRSRH